MTWADLRRAAGGYLSVRRGMGLKDPRSRKFLNEFLRFIDKQKTHGSNLAQKAFEWACLTPRADATASQASRLAVIRGFLGYAKTVFPETEIPPSGMLKSYQRRPPYLFSNNEISRLLDLTRSLTPRGSLRPQTYHTIIGLLSCTGLRASEALHLEVADVQLHLQPPRLHIVETKFLKSRLVPLHPTTADALQLYKERRSMSFPADLSAPFFVSNQGKTIPYFTLKNGFMRLLQRAGIVGKQHHRGPCLHSLRHSFAVQRLTAWYQQGANVQALAPNLSVYLGHARLKDSYWYLSALPELLNAASHRFSIFAEKEGEC